MKKTSKKKSKKVSVKTAKKTVKKAKALAKKWKDFYDWWSKVAEKKVSKMEAAWIKENEPNDPDEDGGGDHWCVNEMMHNGDAHEMTAEIAERVFEMGKAGEKWEYNQSDSLYCELDAVIEEAYEAGKNCKS